MSMKTKKISLIFFSVVALIFITIFSIRFGSVNFSFIEIVKALFVKNYENEILKSILWDIRIPRILIALMVGGNLALAGVLLQAVMKRSEERRVGKECRSRWSPYH